MLIKIFLLFFTAVSARLKHTMYKKKRDDYYCDCFRIGYKSIKSRIVFRVVTRHYVSRTKNKYAKANRIHKSSFVLSISPII